MDSSWIRNLLRSLPDRLSAAALWDVLLWIVAALVVAGLVRLARRWIAGNVEDVNRRHLLSKRVGYAGALFLALLGLSFFVGHFGQLATVVGLVGAGAAIALQDVGKSAAGWLYLTGHRELGPGTRIEVGGLVGEIIDIGILKTTVLEVGNLVYGRQSSGRLASVPNSRLLDESVFFTPSDASYVWQELRFLLTFESDWRTGVARLEAIGRREWEGWAEDAGESFRRMGRRYAFKYGALTPIVYVTVADSGIELTLRYLVPLRRRRGSADRVGRAMLEAVEAEPGLDFAYPTWRVYRQGEGGRSAGSGPVGSGDGRGDEEGERGWDA